MITNFGERVRERRLEEGLSQEELASKVGVSRVYLSQIERGLATNLSWPLVNRIVEALGLSAELIAGTQSDPGLSAEEMARLSNSLREFAEENKLPPDDIRMLLKLEYRGKRPESKDQWKVLYNMIKATLG